MHQLWSRPTSLTRFKVQHTSPADLRGCPPYKKLGYLHHWLRMGYLQRGYERIEHSELTVGSSCTGVFYPGSCVMKASTIREVVVLEMWCNKCALQNGNMVRDVICAVTGSLVWTDMMVPWSYWTFGSLKKEKKEDWSTFCLRPGCEEAHKGFVGRSWITKKRCRSVKTDSFPWELNCEQGKSGSVQLRGEKDGGVLPLTWPWQIIFWRLQIAKKKKKKSIQKIRAENAQWIVNIEFQGLTFLSISSALTPLPSWVNLLHKVTRCSRTPPGQTTQFVTPFTRGRYHRTKTMEKGKKYNGIPPVP